jgi:hypothetical protein
MRGQSITSLLEYEAKRRPEIQEMMDNLESMSDQDIERAVVPLPWFRQALRQLKGERLAEARRLAAELFANGATLSVNPDPMGRTGYWGSNESWIPTTTGRTSILVKSNYPLWFPDTGGVWIDTVFINPIPDMVKGVQTTKDSSFLSYKSEIRELLNPR